MLNPDGAHSIAVGVDAPIDIDIEGHAGYYAGGMNKQARITVHGNAGPGVAENMMSGRVHVKGFASVSAGASGHGGLLVIDGDASLRCGISMKGIDIVVGGRVGDFSAFMAQAGRLVVCGDAGDALGDSLYEAVIYVRGRVKSLGADAHEEPMTDDDYAARRVAARAGWLRIRPEGVQACRVDAQPVPLERRRQSGVLMNSEHAAAPQRAQRSQRKDIESKTPEPDSNFCLRASLCALHVQALRSINE